MRILHLNPFYFPYAGGIERRIREVGRRHARTHDVHLLTAQLDGTAVSDVDYGIQVHRLPSRFRLRRLYNPPLVATHGLGEAIRAIGPDVIDCHFRWSPSYLRAFRRADATRVFTYHNTYGEGSGALGRLSRLNDRATRPTIAASARIVAISRFLERDLTQNGFPAAHIRVVPNGVDAASLRAQAASVPGDPTLIMAVGRLVHVKGYDTAIRAMTRLPGFHLRICGDGPLRPRLARLAAHLGVADRVELPGWVDEPSKLGQLAACAAFVHPSRYEAFGIAPLEAMAMGAPVVASDAGGLPEVVGKAGAVVPVGDAAALAAAVLRLTSDPAARAAAVRQAAEQTRVYSWDRAARGLLDVYGEAVAVPKV